MLRGSSGVPFGARFSNFISRVVQLIGVLIDGYVQLIGDLFYVGLLVLVILENNGDGATSGF